MSHTKGKGHGERDKTKDKCSNCQKLGHWVADCWAKGGGKEGQGPKAKQRGKGGRDKGKSRGKTAAKASASTSSSPEYAFALSKTNFSAIEQKSKGVEITKFSYILDSGASRHFEPKRERFRTYEKITPVPIQSADGKMFYATGRGDVPLAVRNGAQTVRILLRNVLHSEQMPVGLISISYMTKDQFGVNFCGGQCDLIDPQGTTFLTVKERNGLYPLLNINPTDTPTPVPVPVAAAALQRTTKLTLQEFHIRMGHANVKGLLRMVKEGVVEGITLTTTKMDQCDTCVEANQQRAPIPKTRSTPLVESYGDHIHSNVWGPADTKTMGGGHQYYCSHLDEATDYNVLALITNKSDTFGVYRHFAARVCTERGIAIKEHQSDQGGEYTSKEFTDFLASEGTATRRTVHDLPFENGKAEVLNRTIAAHGRAMRLTAGLPKSLWGEAFKHANWLRNRTTTVNTPGSTPFEKANPAHQRPDLSKLPIFGAKCWMKIKSPKSKLDVRGQSAHWVGYDGESKGHRIWVPGTGRIAIERDVVFAKDVTVEGELIDDDDDVAGDGVAEQAPNPVVEPPKVEGEPLEEPEVEESVNIPPPAQEPVVIRTSGRQHKPSQWIRDIKSGEFSTGGRGAQKIPTSILKDASPLANNANSAKVAFGCLDESDEDEGEVYGPLFAFAAMPGDSPSQREALYGAESAVWSGPGGPMETELAMLEKMETWELKPRPPNANVIPSQWVLLKKRDENNAVRKLKARLVGGGHKQIYGVDFDNTSSPTVCLDSLRLLIDLGAEHDWEIDVIDFTSAYLNGELPDDKPVYMQQPPGFVIHGKEDWVLQLKKAIYGLKNAGYHWFNTLRTLLLSIGLQQSLSDPAVFLHILPGHIVIVATHVDDCACFTSGTELMVGLKKQISAQYNIVDLGAIRFMLGFEFRRNREAKTINMSQEAYIATMLERFDMKDAKPVAMPLNPGDNMFVSPVDDEERQLMKRKPYSKLVGSLMYAAIGSRPDIAYAVSTLARFMHNPAPIQWALAKRVLRYLKGTKETALVYGMGSGGLVFYSDSDYALQPDRHSVEGVAGVYNGTAVFWKSTKQKLIALSSTEAEYIAASGASRELVSMRQTYSEFVGPLPLQTPLFIDNQSAIANINSNLINPRTKHIDIRFHYVRETAKLSALITYCPTEDMAADLLTKALSAAQLKYLASLLGLRFA